MKLKTPYQLAEETVDHVTDQCTLLVKLGHDSTQHEKVSVLNYLRTVRTTIELMESELVKVPE